MLIKFKVKNFLSFKEEAIICTEATNITELNETNTFSNYKNKYLKSLAIYGPNSSGKSNLLKALKFLKHFVFNSYKLSLDESTIKSVVPFKFSTSTENQPSTFEIMFIQKQVQYRYGFVLDKEKIFSEWLFSKELKARARENLLFERNKEIHFGPTIQNWNVKQVDISSIRSNVLLLTKLAMDYDIVKNEVLNWFNNINIISGLTPAYGGFTRTNIDSNLDFKNTILNLLQAADIQINDITLEKRPVDINDLPPSLRSKITDPNKQTIELIETITNHNKYDINDQLIGSAYLKLDDEESEGTNQLFNLLGPVIDTINNHKILFVDELDSSLHPHLTQFLVKLFNSPRNQNSQLIFTTHDVSLLDAQCLRRDQIWFTELNKFGASSLFSLSDFIEQKTGKKIRKDADYLKQYLLGRYGAIPLIDKEYEDL